LLWQFDGGGLRDVRRQTLSEGRRVIGVNAGIVGSAGNGNVSEAIVDETVRGFGVDVSENAASGNPLGTVRGHSVAVIELAELLGVECDHPVRLTVHSQGHFAVFEAAHRSQIAIGDAKVFVGRGELDAVSCGELPLYLQEDIHSLQPARVVGDA
jgi:hypothetical protein